MNPWIGKIAYLAGMAALFVIRAPHRERKKRTIVTESRKGVLEKILISLMTAFGGVIPLVYILSPLLSSADHPRIPASENGME